ncbi:MAG: hypothetical protein IJY09_11250 [Lachnospiraceae bacterium]|nr:hypothetical protein [Lachnospiraceae bacterium]
MARCLKCNAEIPDGQEYCSDCMEQENNEAYLDAAQKDAISEPTITDHDGVEELADILALDVESEVSEEAEEPVSDMDMLNDILALDAESEVSEEAEESVSDMDVLNDILALDAESMVSEEPEIETVAEEPKVEAENDMESLDSMFSEDMSDFDRLASADAGRYDITRIQEGSDSDMDFDKMFAEDLLSMEKEEALQLSELEELISEESAESEMLENSLALEESAVSDEQLELEERLVLEETAEADDILAVEESVEPELFSAMEEPVVSEEMPEAEDATSIEDFMTMTEGNAEPEGEAEAEGEMDQDILDLLNSMNSSEEEGMGAQEDALDVLALSEEYGTEDDLEAGRKPAENIEDIFSDTLRAVDSLSEEEGTEQNAKGKKKKAKKAKKPGFFKRVFGNIKTERSEEEIARMKEKVIADAEAKERAEQEKKQQAAQAKEEKKQKAAQEKAEAKQQKAEKAKQKAEKKAEAARKKKEIKDKKQQEIQNLIDEIENDEGRINRVGATIVFVVFAILAAAILIGTNIYSYNVKMESAQEDFGNKRYGDAYENIYGLNIREEDEDFYLQVMTVMYTYKQLNSFESYYEMDQYPQALDSLLKGLRRYEKYSTVASLLGIEKDMLYVRDEIVEQLEDVYKLSELEAVKLAAIENQEEYTRMVYEIATIAERKRR